MSFSSCVFSVHCPCSLDSLSAPQQLAAHCAGTNVPILEQEKVICIHEKKEVIFIYLFTTVVFYLQLTKEVKYWICLKR